MMRPPNRLLACVALLLLTSLGGCTFGSGGGGRMTADDREAVADCGKQSDRIYAARNRYELSEQDTSNTPFSGNTLPYNPAAGLRDQYERDQYLDDCLNRSAAGDAVVPGSTPAPTRP
jgi:hypothetical protein